jgi:hypothetical protein
VPARCTSVSLHSGTETPPRRAPRKRKRSPNGGRWGAYLSAAAVNNDANAITTAHAPRTWKRSACSTSALQFVGGAPGSQVTSS